MITTPEAPFMKTILIVDDYRPMLQFEKRVLIGAGFDILEAEDGAAALEIAKAKLPDLIISDVKMDNLNGFMLIERLRDDPVMAKIPVILVTGEAQNAGMWDSDRSIGYLRKPVSPEQLLSAVEKCFNS
jgi:CheY-like chemotaxis protein